MRAEWNTRVAGVAAAAYARLLRALAAGSIKLPGVSSELVRGGARRSVYRLLPAVGLAGGVGADLVARLYGLLSDPRAAAWRAGWAGQDGEVRFLRDLGGEWRGAEAVLFVKSVGAEWPAGEAVVRALSAAGCCLLLLLVSSSRHDQAAASEGGLGASGPRCPRGSSRSSP